MWWLFLIFFVLFYFGFYFFCWLRGMKTKTVIFFFNVTNNNNNIWSDTDGLSVMLWIWILFELCLFQFKSQSAHANDFDRLEKYGALVRSPFSCSFSEFQWQSDLCVVRPETSLLFHRSLFPSGLLAWHGAARAEAGCMSARDSTATVCVVYACMFALKVYE